jgi:hypothetical protein
MATDPAVILYRFDECHDAFLREKSEIAVRTGFDDIVRSQAWRGVNVTVDPRSPF